MSNINAINVYFACSGRIRTRRAAVRIMAKGRDPRIRQAPIINGQSTFSPNPGSLITLPW